MSDFTAYTPVGRIAEALGEARRAPIARYIAEGLETYPDRVTSGPSEALRSLEDATRNEDWRARYGSSDTTLPLQQSMLSGNLEGQFLQMLVAFGGASQALEIGMFTGFGALAMAEALPDAGRVVALEIDPFVSGFAREQFDASPHGSKIDIVIGPALESLKALAQKGEQFDFIFIDADKGGYWDYYTAILDHDLLAPNGLICIDNTLLGGEAFLSEEELGQPTSENGSAIRDFNDKLSADLRTVQVLLPIRDGVTLVRRAPE